MMTKGEQLQRAVEMIRQQRWVAMATVDARGEPSVSMVAYAVDEGESCLYLHLSRLAAHTRELLLLPHASLLLAEADDGRGDPQQLARLSLRGRCEVLAQGDVRYESARRSYLQRLPEALPRFDFSDFLLFRFTIEGARFVGGFGQAYSYGAEEIARLLQRP